MELDGRFHDLLVSQSKNGRLVALMQTLRLGIRRYEHLYMADVKLIPTSVAQHRDIIHAVEEGDLDRALQAVEVNYLFGMRILLRRMGEE